ncbi:lipopolysaccharide biosynthesis protein [Pseudoclavibacter sp. RFBB5]|uniref:lipopolysaccharide biosynthesis protein n=1 Tax=Pseudoclavibacter sp. RFBB5 TaxID=2080574 RepID=UPI000CE7C968|nr:lipopolysaccharide biosynthesis protein [Pseudoclavibacter sp. RFBB5]PPG33468.1 lipopolysaccharide biosynthesis protein [Pseudoclavibacter sp. RFBB5]
MTISSFGRQASRGGMITMIGQVARIGTQLVSLVILARLLAPDDFGLMAMVVAVVGVGEVVRDFGLSSAAVQAASLSRGQRDKLFWINSGIGLALGLVCASMAPLLAYLYDRPELVAITIALSPTFLLNGLSTQHRANLNREMKFARLAIVETLAPVMALVVGVAIALLSGGYWALVGQQLALAVFTLLLSVCLGPWLPGGWRRDADVRPFMRFGLNLLLVQLLNYASRNIDSVVIGARFGAQSLGLYDRAFQLVMKPVAQINAPAVKVALPTLAKLQESPDFARFVLAGQRLLLLPLIALLGFLAASSPVLVVALLGDEWEGSALYVSILSVGAIAQVGSYCVYWIFLAKGLTGSNLKYALVTRPIMIAMVLMGALVSPELAAAGYSASLLVMWPLGIWWIRRVPGVPARSMAWNGFRTLLTVTPASVVVAAFALHWSESGELPGWIALVLSLVLYAVSYSVTLAIWPAARRDFVFVSTKARDGLRRA